jgi:hypothetical protein
MKVNKYYAKISCTLSNNSVNKTKDSTTTSVNAGRNYRASEYHGIVSFRSQKKKAIVLKNATQTPSIHLNELQY